MTYTWLRAETSQIISNSPACVGALLLTPKATKATTIALHDGSSASDPVIIKVRTATGETKAINFQPYLVTFRGLYVTVDGDLDGLIIQLGITQE